MGGLVLKSVCSSGRKEAFLSLVVGLKRACGSEMCVLFQKGLRESLLCLVTHPKWAGGSIICVYFRKEGDIAVLYDGPKVGFWF